MLNLRRPEGAASTGDQGRKDSIMGIYSNHPAIRVQGEQILALTDAVCIEDTFRLYLNDIALAQIVASPDQLRELGAGFVLSEGLAQAIDELRVSDNEVRVYASTSAKIDYELRSSGCIGVRGMPRPVPSKLTIEKEDIFLAIGQIESDVWKKTGGVHCSVLVRDREVVAKSSDIGRHNTLDKVIGHAVLNSIDLAGCIIGCTGRQPAGMIAKVANAGVPIMVSKAAATDAGILLAERTGVALVCFARGDRFTVYSHPERIAGLSVPEQACR